MGRKLWSRKMVGATVFVVTVACIYLTPLKYINVIEPHSRDVPSLEMYARMQKNPDEYLFIDVRPKNLYDKEHATGSLNVELARLYYERHKLPKTGKKIVLICSGGMASGVAYGYLEHYGFFNLYRIEGGIEQWKISGLPTESTPL